MYDFTNIESPRFEYKVRGPDGEPANVSLDMEWALVQLQMRLPTAFKPTDVMDDQGRPMTGLAVVWRAFAAREPVPEYLPSIEHVLAAARTVLRVPDHCGAGVAIAVLTAFLEEINARVASKKDGPDSPASSAPTPA